MLVTFREPVLPDSSPEGRFGVVRRPHTSGCLTHSAVSQAQTAFRLLLGAALVFAETSHLFWSRLEFRAQVPRWLPLPVDLVVVGSGLAELALGGARLSYRRRFKSAFFGVVPWKR